MAKGKQTCKILKEIRKQIAEENDINLIIEECTYQGDCLGTCPRCEAEVRYLERELEKRQRLGKAAVVAGLSVGLLGASQVALAQTPDSLRIDSIQEISEQEVFGIVETMPDFRGGPPKLHEFIKTNLNYPQEAIDAGVEGKVFVEFCIEKDGTVCDAKVLRGIGYGCDEEVLRVVDMMPKWAPGKQRGEAVRVRYTLPINFKLPDPNEKSVLDENVAPVIGEVADPEREVFTIVEQMPEFPGGQDSLDKYIKENMRYGEMISKYQADAIGRIFVNFIVEPDGSITNVKVVRGIYEHYDEEAVRVVKSMPKWKPGKQYGKPVRVSYTIPVVFKWY